MSDVQLDRDYDRYDALDGRRGVYTGEYRLADYFAGSGKYAVFLTTMDGKTHIYGICDDGEKSREVCDLWVSEGLVSDHFYKRHATITAPDDGERGTI